MKWPKQEFPVFNAAELVVGIALSGKLHKKRNRCFNRMGKTSTSRCFRNGLCKMQRRWNFKSSVDKFYDQDDLVPGQRQLEQAGDMIFFLSGPADKTRTIKRIAYGISYSFGIKKPANLHFG
jgi:hypothetical protein